MTKSGWSLEVDHGQLLICPVVKDRQYRHRVVQGIHSFKISFVISPRMQEPRSTSCQARWGLCRRILQSRAMSRHDVGCDSVSAIAASSISFSVIRLLMTTLSHSFDLRDLNGIPRYEWDPDDEGPCSELSSCDDAYADQFASRTQISVGRMPCFKGLMTAIRL